MNSTNQNEINVGIDTSQDILDVYIRPKNLSSRLKGTVKLIQFLPFWRRNVPTRRLKINDLVHQPALVLPSIWLT